MQDNTNFFVINNLWTPNQPNEDALDTSLHKNLRKPMLEMHAVRLSPTHKNEDDYPNQNSIVNEEFEGSRSSESYNYNSNSNRQMTKKTEEAEGANDLMNNYRSVRLSPFMFSQNQDKKMNGLMNSNQSTAYQQQQQSSTQIQFNSGQDKNANQGSALSFRSSSSVKKNEFSGIGQDISISFPQLSASQSFSQGSINRGETQSPTKFNNLGVVVKHKKSSFLKRSSMVQQEQKNKESGSSSGSDSYDSGESEKRDTLPAQLFTLGKEKDNLKKEKTPSSSDEDSQYDSFTVRMNSLKKFKMNSSAPLRNLIQGGEVTQIKINKDAFSSNSSASIQTQQQDNNALQIPMMDAEMRQSSQSLRQSGQLGNSILSGNGSGGFVDLIKKLKIRAAIQRMASKTSYRRLQQLSEQHLSFIGDKSIQKKSDDKSLKDKQRWYLLLIQQYMNFPTFNPYSIYKMTWDLFMLFVVFFFFISIPLLLSTGDEFEGLFGEFPYYIPSLILVIDAFINMNTGYYRNGALVVSKYFVLRNYAKKLLAIDVIGIIPIFIYTIQPQSTLKSFLFLYFIKYKSITKIFKRLELRLDLKSSLLNFIALLKLLFTVLFIAHIFANFWLFLARENPNQNWLASAKIKCDKWYEQYMLAYYYITVTMVTVGYGDITPANLTEVFFAIVTILLACGVFAYSVNAIGFILDEINREQKLLNKNMQIINQYMNKKNISRELRFQVREYLEFFWRQKNIGNIELEQQIISQLAHNLKEKLFVEANTLILKDNKVLSSKFSERILMKTLSIVKEYKFTPSQIIISRHQQDDSAIYFIESGNVEVFIENEKNHETIEIQSQQRSLSVRSIDFATLLKIEREDFINLLKMSPRDEERFHLIKDIVLFSNGYGELGVGCYSCNSRDHLLGTCPMVQFVPNKLYCYKRYNFNPGQQRQQFKRIMKEKYSTLKDIDLLKDAAENIQDDYEEFMPETQSSHSELSCIEDVDEEDEDDDDEEFYKQTPRHKPLLGDSNRQSLQPSIFSQALTSPSHTFHDKEKNEEEQKETSPITPENRRKALSTQYSPNNNNNIIHEDSGESDSQQSNNRISIESKNNDDFLLHQPPSLYDNKRIKFQEQDNASASSSSVHRRDTSSNENSISHTSIENIIPKIALTNQTIKHSKFGKGISKLRRSSAIEIGESFEIRRKSQLNKNDSSSQKEEHLQTDYSHHDDSDQLLNKESIANAKSLLLVHQNKEKTLQSVHSSSLMARRSHSNDTKTPLLSFSQSVAQQQTPKKEFPRISQLRKDKSGQNSPKSGSIQFSSSNSPFSLSSNMNNGIINPQLCNQCQNQLEQFQTTKSHFKLNGDNYGHAHKGEKEPHYGSILVTRSRGNSMQTPYNNPQGTPSNLLINFNHHNSISTLNYSNSIGGGGQQGRNSVFHSQHLNSRRNSINRGINGIQLPLEQHSIYQQAMMMKGLKHKDSFSSSNSPKSRRHLSTSSSKYNRIEMAFLTDQLTKKVNAIYDKLYTGVQKEDEKFSLEFDKQKDYEIYFPKFNLPQVLKRKKDKKKLTHINKFIQAFNLSRGQSYYDENDRSRTSTTGNRVIGRSISANYTEMTSSLASPKKNRSARSSIFVPQNGLGRNSIKGLKLRPSLNADGQWEIKSATFPKKTYF